MNSTPITSDSAKLFVFSGAGLSAESGVATFRTAGGLWTQNNLSRVCNWLTWKDHRSEVFEFYQGRRAECAAVNPNAAHRRLADWQARWGTARVQLLTQNVDDLLERAGASAVVHLHGDLQHLQCTACGHRWLVADTSYCENTRCAKCNSFKGVKPGVVFFREAAPEYVHLRRLTKKIRPQDILLVVGSSLEVISAEHLVPRRRFGHELNWQVNPEPVDAVHFGWVLAQGAVSGLQAVEGRLASLLDAS